ncbi:MAG TPA: hypothetical protein PLC06_12315, partial [Promineifilum sp.]|nr:hypothetical protein [Promineifilum sp.]
PHPRRPGQSADAAAADRRLSSAKPGVITNYELRMKRVWGQWISIQWISIQWISIQWISIQWVSIQWISIQWVSG